MQKLAAISKAEKFNSPAVFVEGVKCPMFHTFTYFSVSTHALTDAKFLVFSTEVCDLERTNCLFAIRMQQAIAC